MPEEPNNRRGIIELLLSPEEVDQLCGELMKTPGANLAQRIIDTLKDRGIEVRKAAAQTFQDKVFANYRDRLKKRSELAQFISANSNSDDNTLIADAAGGELAQLLFEFMAEEKDSIDLSTEEGRKAANNLGLVIARLRAGDHRLRRLEEDLKQEREARAAEQLKAREAVELLTGPQRNGLGVEDRNRIRRELGCRLLEADAA